MLEMAEVGKDDVVCDLGGGDGRIVIRAAKKFGARGLEIEMDAEPIELSKRNAREEGVGHLVKFRAEDALRTNIFSATVVTLYMIPRFNGMMRPVSQRTLKPGARVVPHELDFEGWPPDRVEKTLPVEHLKGGQVHRHTLLLWTIR